ncbi:MAG: class II glutamine amidotransferase [Myxococcaceae bacterium]|nr:class II glutamine amidotransferase [Myxococcaceae bacterium]
MTRVFAIATSDPSLMRCELDRARQLVTLDGEGLVAGLGAYDEQVLVQRSYGVGVTRSDMWDLPSSETALFVAHPAPVGRPLEDVAQPFRMRQWLFAMAGELPARAGQVRERLVEQLPEFLQRSLRGPSVDEVVFATFLAELRSLGRTEDPDLEAPIAAQLLGRTASHVEEAVGPATRPGLSLMATNGRIVVATARGGHPLFYKLLEGDSACARCELSGDEKVATALVRDHRRRRSVLLATHPLRPEGWVPVADGRSVAVGRSLELQLV